MPADITLVKGARDAAPKFRKIELFSEEQLQTMQKATMARKALKATRDAAISALVSDITVNESLTPPQQIDAQYAAAGNIRNQVAQLAAQRAKLPVNSPEAFALDQQISTLKQSFTNIATSAKDFQELQQEYIDGSWNMSGGVDPTKQKQLDAIFAENAYTIEFDERGNATYITEFGNMSQKDLSNYYLKDDEMALQIVDYSDEALSLGSQGTQIKKDDSRYNMLKTKIRNDIRKGGEARINSLIYDPLVDGFDLQLTDLGDQQLNEDQAVEAIMARLIDVNDQGYKEYKAKPSNKTGREQESEVAVTRNELESIDIGKDITPDRIYDDQKSEPRPKRFGPRKISDTLTDYNNVIGAEGYQIVINNAGEYVLENQNPMSQNEREKFGQEEIQDELDELLKGNRDPLIRKIMVEVYGETSMDRKNADKTFAQ